MIYAFLMSVLVVYPNYFLFFANRWVRAAFLGYIAWFMLVDTKVGGIYISARAWRGEEGRSCECEHKHECSKCKCQCECECERTAGKNPENSPAKLCCFPESQAGSKINQYKMRECD
jgi:hypothetical protein